MSCPRKLKAELKKLKEEMSYKPGTEILLAISIASDEMTRHVHMFPEVFYMDVTYNTNRQKRDLFVMVLKDASGETFVGNLTVIPSGQLWVYMKIYQTFFLKLYGGHTISRNRLALTDDDKTEYGPFENCIKTNEFYEDSTHMLCIFHAIVKAYHERVYPLLPARNKGGKRLLTKLGKDYCKLFCILFHMVSTTL